MRYKKFNIILFVTAQYERMGLLTDYFVFEYNGMWIPDMKPKKKQLKVVFVWYKDNRSKNHVMAEI